MGEETTIQFSERGYRQLVAALREARPTEAPQAEPEPLDILVSEGEAAYLDQQNLMRWVKLDRVSDVPATWRPLLVGRSRAEAAG
jgi:hypothetical protein